jgi:hypothetical protein
MESNDVTIIHVQPEPYFGDAFRRAQLFQRSPRTYRIAYWYWEFDSIPESWVEHARQVDEVWAATEFVARGLRARLSVPVRTLFPGVKLAPYEKRERAYFGLSDEPFTFLFMFHMMSVMERKNPLGLIRAFKTAFRPDEPVRLVLKSSYGDRHPAQLQELRDTAAGANIVVIDQVYSPDDVLSLMDACDAYVSLHRSEGLGLTMAEAMLMGKPVIATNFSGNVDFMDDSNSLLVPYELVKLGWPIPPYDGHLEWAQPSVEHAARSTCGVCTTIRPGPVNSGSAASAARKRTCRSTRQVSASPGGWKRLGRCGAHAPEAPWSSAGERASARRSARAPGGSRGCIPGRSDRASARRAPGCRTSTPRPSCACSALCVKSASPTDSHSSISRMSAWTLVEIENARRISMPVE